jgi:nucleoside-diphosphate-sugar epimerase
MSGRKIVMTGGTGFILSYVAERYAEAGDTVVLFDNNEQHQMPRYTADLLEKRKNVSFVQGDIRDKAAVENVIKGADMVYHFAALMGTSSRFKQEVRTIEVNVIGTLHVCQAALDANVKYYIYPPRPMKTGWRTPYIISKTAATELTQMYHEIYGLRTVGLNIANCYGPRERAVLEANPLKPGEGRKMMATFVEAALKNEPLPVMGDGEQSSDFVFIDDVIDACMMAPTDAAIGRIIEVGTGINTSVKRVAEMIIELTGSKSKIEFKPLRTGEVKIDTTSDTVEAKKYLGWQWQTNLQDGLRKTIPWYAQQLGLELPRNFAA